jgi:hypothetical protein
MKCVNSASRKMRLADRAARPRARGAGTAAAGALMIYGARRRCQGTGALGLSFPGHFGRSRPEHEACIELIRLRKMAQCCDDGLRFKIESQ